MLQTHATKEATPFLHIEKEPFDAHLVVLHARAERPHVPPDALVLDADARRRHGVELRPQRPHNAPEQLLRAVEAFHHGTQPPDTVRRELDRVRRADALAWEIREARLEEELDRAMQYVKDRYPDGVPFDVKDVATEQYASYGEAFGGAGRATTTPRLILSCGLALAAWRFAATLRRSFFVVLGLAFLAVVPAGAEAVRWRVKLSSAMA